MQNGLGGQSSASSTAKSEGQSWQAYDGLVDDPDRQLLILFASQTGSAQDVAEYIGREAWRRHFKARVQDVKDFDRTELLDAPPTIIVTATTGQGAFPTSILPLWNFLVRSDLPHELLQDFSYAIFGLGDSSYPKFNWPARKLKRRLEQLGAMELIEKGEADDQHYLGIDGTLLPWLDSLWSTLLQHFPLPPGIPVIPGHIRPPPRLRLQHIQQSNGSSNYHIPISPTLPVSHMRSAKLVQNSRVTASDHFQDTRHIILELEDPIHYEAGDILEVRPQNLPENVDEFLRISKWDTIADHVIEISGREHALPAHWPRRTTLREMSTRYLDIFSVPRRSFFEWLSYFTTSELETEKLREFCTSEGQEDMYDYANRPRRTICEVLAEFKSAQIPLEYIADIFPEIRPRQFSIASSSKLNNRRVELLVAIVKYQTMLKAPRRGVATSWLSTLQEGATVPIDLIPGTMRLPESSTTPILLVGPGTGIAPFRAMVQERLALNPDATQNLVFFGCRSASKDFYFQDEWKRLQDEGKLRLVLAASRDGDEKVYVQHRIKQEAALVWEYLDCQAGVVYVSGSSGQMPKAVQKALKHVFQTEGRMSEEEADAYFARLEAQGRYVEETWS